MSRYKIKKSVRELIEFVLRTGDIQPISIGTARMKDGIKAHQKYGKQQGEQYECEVWVETEWKDEFMTIQLSGRIDGVLVEDERVLIDEVKSTGKKFEDLEKESSLHWAQVSFYGYMYALEHGLEQVDLRLTYISLETNEIKQTIKSNQRKSELKDFVEAILTQYAKWAIKIEDWKEVCRASIRRGEFPFLDFRKGQKSLMGNVYKAIESKEVLFVRAPTGIGKTIATLFPALKGLGNGLCDKVFYLTAKTIGRKVAIETLDLLEQQGITLKRIEITAKDKICIHESEGCNPDTCLYAKGHYDRVNKVIEKIYEDYDYFSGDLMKEFAIKHTVCPYELSLDLAMFSEVIICDYNYVFDPNAALKRFFTESSERYAVLVDEAHNLVDRARDNYSAKLYKSTVLDLKKKSKQVDKTLYRYLTQLNQWMLDKRKDIENDSLYEIEMPYTCIDLLKAIIFRIEKIFTMLNKTEYKEDYLDFYFAGYNFIKKSELYDEKYKTYYLKEQSELKVKMFCIDPSENIRNAIENVHGLVFFSATLLPMQYYVQLLGGNKKSLGLSLSSPFWQENLGLFIYNTISTKYKQRQTSIQPIVEIIVNATQVKKGNYMVFFPSYQYMESIYEAYMGIKPEQQNVIIQKRGMSEEENKLFIEEFSRVRETTLTGFAVLGGMFGEGIDLVGEQLSGAIIVGVGLPQICLERNLIKEYYKTNGFLFAYTYPGMNKVLQSAGRVIRTSTDQGFVILIDERFGHPVYKKLFPKEWSHCKLCSKPNHLSQVIAEFWDSLEH